MRAALIARQFDVQGRLVTVAPYGSGNVNDTYLAITRTTFRSSASSSSASGNLFSLIPRRSCRICAP